MELGTGEDGSRTAIRMDSGCWIRAPGAEGAPRRVTRRPQAPSASVLARMRGSRGHGLLRAPDACTWALRVRSTSLRANPAGRLGSGYSVSYLPFEPRNFAKLTPQQLGRMLTEAIRQHACRAFSGKSVELALVNNPVSGLDDLDITEVKVVKANTRVCDDVSWREAAVFEPDQPDGEGITRIPLHQHT